MNQEIERKFLVDSNDFKSSSFKSKYIKQGFLNSHKERVVRIRIIDDIAYITVKGISNNTGTARFEWEKQISSKDANNLMLLCEPGIIEKKRYYHKVGDHTFEIDEFFGENEGLLIAEVELSHEDEFFEKPEYLGLEVTGDEKYYNSNLSTNPFKKWA